MLLKTSSLKGLPLKAYDGEIGSISDVLFEDDTWRVRWLVVDTGSWLMGRKVLLPASHIHGPRGEASAIDVDLTKKQIEDSPGSGTDLPVSRQVEMSLYESYGWDPYWTTPGMPYVAGTAYPVLPAAPVPATGGAPALGALPAATQNQVPEVGKAADEQGDPHLRSANEVIGYYIHARDGDIGHVEDIVVEGDDWSIHSVIVDTKNWWPGRMVLIQPDWLESISWSERYVHLFRTRDEVKRADEYDPLRPENDRSEHRSMPS